MMIIRTLIEGICVFYDYEREIFPQMGNYKLVPSILVTLSINYIFFKKLVEVKRQQASHYK